VACDEDIVGRHQALLKLEHADPRASRVVELRFFGGLQGAEIAEALGISEITVKRNWKVARAWLVSRFS
jgi:RNA polymerase sigma factor (sigma-70 family)